MGWKQKQEKKESCGCGDRVKVENGCFKEQKKRVLYQPVFLRALKLYVFCNKNIKKHEADRE